MKVQRCHHIYVDAPVCNKIWCWCWCWIISATDERHLVLLRPLLVSQSSVRRSLHTPPTRTPVKHRRNKSWRKIFERYNKRSSLRKQIQYQGEFCNMRVCFNCRLDHWNCYYINIRFFLVMCTFSLSVLWAKWQEFHVSFVFCNSGRLEKQVCGIRAKPCRLLWPLGVTTACEDLHNCLSLRNVFILILKKI